MRIVLFGAGASYGCGNVSPRTPPLGRDLFPSLQRLYPGWRSIPDETAQLFERNFEDGMATVIEQHGFAVGPLMQEMAIFFSIFSVSANGQNRYVDILRSASTRDDVFWSTINYECLLETAATLLGRKVAYFGNPAELEKNVCPIWKLHGSCNFKVKGLEATRGVSYSGTGVTFGGRIEAIDLGSVRQYYSSNTALYPAMCLYAAGKPISMSPGPITEGQKQWANHVTESEKVLLIGIYPNPADDHLWKALGETNAALACIGSEPAFLEWVGSNRQGKQSIFLGAKWEMAEQSAIEFISG